MKVVDSVVSASVSRVSVVWNVSLGEEVHYVAGSIYDWGSNDADVIWDVCARDIGLQERRMDLSRVEKIAGLGI